MMPLKWIAAFGVLLLGIPVSAEESPVLKTQQDKISYALGVDLGRNIRRQAVEADLDLVIRGLRDGHSGEKFLMTEEELRSTIRALQAELSRGQAEGGQKPGAAEDNKKEGEAFLAENKTKEGVVTLPSGLQYKILKAGEGRRPTVADTVQCRYRGTLINGTEFASSPRDGQPATIKVGSLIPGWREALKLMPVGSKWQLFIPPHLAYGMRRAGPVIGPNSTLIYEVELIAIK